MGKKQKLLDCIHVRFNKAKSIMFQAVLLNLVICLISFSVEFPQTKVFALPLGGTPPPVDLPDLPFGSNTTKLLPAWTSQTYVSVTSPAHGSAVYEREGHSQVNYIPSDDDRMQLGYDENGDLVPVFETGALWIEGFVHNVKKRWVKKGRIEVLVDGVRASLRTNYSRKRKGYYYSLWLPMPELEAYGAPLSEEFGWPQRLLTVEVYDNKTDTVLARKHSVYFDLRDADTANHAFNANTKIPGMHAQLTNLGVGGESSPGNPYGLEIPHIESLPHPNLQSFNDTFTTKALKIKDYAEDNLGACISLSDISEENFKSELKFSALAQIKALASTYYATYQVASNGTAACGLAAPACAAAADKMCVKKLPKTRDFELCVERIEGEVQSASIDSIDDVTLEFEPSIKGLGFANMESDILVSGIEGRVNGKLRDLKLRWKKSGCLPRPKVKVSNQYVVDTDWANEWATCRNVEIRNDTATTDFANTPTFSAAPAKFMVSPESAESETLKVYQTSDPDFYYGLTGVDYEKGTCAEEFIIAAAADMANSFSGKFTDKFEQTWNKGGSFTGQAKMLEALLSPYELGEVAQEDHNLIATYETVMSNISNVVKGAGIGYETVFLPEHQDDWNRFDTAMLYVPPRVEGDVRFHPEGINDRGQEFDAGFSVTTGYLNQRLNTLRATSRLNFNLQPTWTDIVGFELDPISPPPLNGESLKSVDPIFSELGTKEIQIKVSPSLDPIVWMDADPPGEEEIPGIGFPLAYGVWALDVRFAEPDKVKRRTGKIIPGKVWLHAQIFVHDSDFRLTHARENGETTLYPVFEDEEWFLRVADNNFSTCDMVATHHGMGPNICETVLEANLLGLLKGGIREKLISMVSDIPAPQFFDVEGESNKKMQTTTKSRLHEDQYIKIYADFDEVYE